MQNPQRLIFQQLPERGGEENLRGELPEPGTDAKNIASQASAKLERFFEGTTVSQLYKQIQEATERINEIFYKDRVAYNTIAHQSNEALSLIIDKLVQLTPRNEEEKSIILHYLKYSKTTDGTAHAFPSSSPTRDYSYVQKRRGEVEAMHFATVTELNGKLNSLSRTDEWERIIQLTPLNEDERQIILRAIEHLEKYTPAYDSGHPDAQKLHPVHLDKRRKEVKALKF
ncbi:MAG: hypothetical protein AAB739_04035 [Patescibacteria group bacterium]